MNCPKSKLIAYSQDENGKWLATRTRCKSWLCPACAISNRLMWRNFLARKLAKINAVWYFGTITAPSWHREPETSLLAIRDNFDRFMKRLKRVFKTGVEYVRVYEVHKTGAFHLHIVVSGLAERVEKYTARSGKTAFRPVTSEELSDTWHIQTWWKKTLAKCGCGYIAEIKIIPRHQAVKYVTKYLTKEAQDFTERGLRRIQTSQGIGSPKASKTLKWAVVEAIWDVDVNHEGLRDCDEKKSIPASYWRDNLVYPPEK